MILAQPRTGCNTSPARAIRGKGDVFYLILLAIILALALTTRPVEAALQVTDAPAPPSVDLTTTGPADWVHWGYRSGADINRKTGVVSQIGALTTGSGNARRYQPPAGARISFNWSDGAPSASATTSAGLYINDIGNRYELPVPADTSSRTLVLYAGGWKARGRLDFILSDGSAPPRSLIIDNPNGVIDREVTITYTAASAGQSLLVTYTLIDDYGGIGNITIAAAALVDSAVNQPPTLASIGNQIATAGQLLSFGISASDPDGPPPLMLAAGPLPQGASFTDKGNGSGVFNWTPTLADIANSPYTITFYATDDNGAGLSSTETIQITVRSSSAKPNIVLIMADDLGYGDIGIYGSTTIATPNIDQLAAEGLRFTDFYAAPSCQMARAQLMTGSYSSRVSLSSGMLPNSIFGINPNETTLAEILKTAGYATGIFGKWHLGDAPEFLPMKHGFDEFFGLPYSNDMWPFHPKICQTPNEDPRLTAARARANMTGLDGHTTPCWPTDIFPDLPLMNGDQVVEINPDQSTLNTRYTDQALQFMRRNAGQPFFVYLPYTAPHVPLHPDPAFVGSSQADLYGDTVQELDYHIGRILNELDTLGLTNDTLVIFTSDNGPWLEYGIDGGSAGPLRKGKSTIFEGGVRVPAVMKWPGLITPGSQTQAVAGLIDILPTLASIAGATLPQGQVIDGKDLTPLIQNPTTASAPRSEHYFYTEAPSYDVDQSLYLRAMRSGKWKLHLRMSGSSVTARALYDLDADLGETTDILASNPAIAQTMLNQAQAFNDLLRQNSRPAGTKSITGGSGGLIVSDTMAPSNTNLTALGTADWIHWGLQNASSVNRKSGVAPQIGPLATVGGSINRFQAPAGARVNLSWSDGAPTASASTTAGLYLMGTGNRYEFSVQADTNSQTLTLYPGAWKARGRLDFSLSDGTASPVSILVDNPSGVIDREVSITFSAASSGQALLVTYTLVDDYGTGGNITLAGAALSGTPTQVNQPPVLTPIGNKAVTEGQLLSFQVSATDPDGPPPLVLTASPLPSGASFADNGNGSGLFSWTPTNSDVSASPYMITFSATDNNGAGLSSTESIQITVNPAGAGGSGVLTASDASAPSAVDLSATGIVDWVHWGLQSSSSVNRKGGVLPQISSLVASASPRRYQAPSGARISFSWNDGSPSVNATTSAGLYLNDIGNRYELTVPADTSSRTLVLYAGAWKARGKLDISLSDGSASPASIIIDNPNGVIDRAVTITFSAASPSQTLLISYSLVDDYGGNGNITLAGATLGNY